MIIAFEFIFETAENLPPPFSHTYRLKGDLQNTFELDYELFYSGREQLSEEEIFDEGFSMEDDAHFQGEMPNVWKEEVLNLINDSQPSEKTLSEEENRLFLKITNDTGKVQEFTPQNAETWEQIAQEMVQGLLESQEIEKPLSLAFKKNTRLDNITITAEVYFAEKQAKLLIFKNNDKSISQFLSWQEAQKLMNLTFNNEFEGEFAKPKEPRNQGFHLNLGDTYWFEAKKAVFSISQKNNTLVKLEQFLLQFVPK